MEKVSLSTVERLQGLMWNAAHDPCYQPELLEAARQWLGGSNATLSIRDPAVPESGTFATLVYEPVLIPKYVEQIQDEPWLAEGTRLGFCGTTIAEHLVPRRAYRKTRFFTDFMKPLDVGDGVFCGVAGRNHIEAFFTVNRSLRQAGFEKRHARQLQQLERTFCESSRVTLTRRAALGSIPSILLRPGAIESMDANVDVTLRRAGITGLESGAVVTGHPDLDERVAAWMDEAFQGRPSGLVTFRHIDVDDPLSPLNITLLPERWVTADWTAVYGVRLFVQNTLDRLAPNARRFGVSPRELQILAALCGGMSVKQIARRSGRSPQTIRSQVKSLLRKTGAHSQRDLVHLFEVC